MPTPPLSRRSSSTRQERPVAGHGDHAQQPVRQLRRTAIDVEPTAATPSAPQQLWQLSTAAASAAAAAVGGRRKRLGGGRQVWAAAGGGGGGFGGGSSAAVAARQRPINRGGNEPASGGGSVPSARRQRGRRSFIGQVYVVADADTNSLLVATATKFQEQVQDDHRGARPAGAAGAHQGADRRGDARQLRRPGRRFLGPQPARQRQRARRSAATSATPASRPPPAGWPSACWRTTSPPRCTRWRSQGKLDVLSRPYILASDNQLATHHRRPGSAVHHRHAADRHSAQQINTIQYQDIGIILNVTPHINPEGLVILDVAPEISQLTGTTVPISAGRQRAGLRQARRPTAAWASRDGQTIVIGGLMQDQKTSTLQQDPAAGRHPAGSGVLFQRNQVEQDQDRAADLPHAARGAAAGPAASRCPRTR